MISEKVCKKTYTLNSIINEHARVRFLEFFANLLAHFQPARLLIS